MESAVFVAPSSPLTCLRVLFLGVLGLTFFAGCTKSDEALTQEVRELVAEQPQVIHEVIISHPALFSEVLEAAFLRSRELFEKERALKEEAAFAASFKHPLSPRIRGDEVVRGNPQGALVLVEYIDFECPFCRRGQEAIAELERRYPQKLKVVLKHMPLSFHPLAVPSARYFEALRLQDASYALTFYERVFRDQAKLGRGDIFLSEIAQEVGANMNQLARDLAHNKAINRRIQEDLAEARSFGFQGTPSYILGGIPIRGAYPVEHFLKVVRELEKRQQVLAAP